MAAKFSPTAADVVVVSYRSGPWEQALQGAAAAVTLRRNDSVGWQRLSGDGGQVVRSESHD